MQRSTTFPAMKSWDFCNKLPGLESFHQHGYGCPSIIVATLGGIPDITHPFLRRGSLLINNDVDYSKAHIKGTQVAAIIIGQKHGVYKGIAHGTTLLSLNISSDNENENVYSAAELAKALHLACDYRAQIINISSDSHSLESISNKELLYALKRCLRENRLIIASTNKTDRQKQQLNSPLEGVLFIAAGEWQARYNHSYEGFYGDTIVAPGQRVPTSNNSGEVIYVDGVEFATAIVSSIAALMLSLQKGLGIPINALQVKQWILSSADVLNPCPTIAPNKHPQKHLNLREAYRMLIKEFRKKHVETSGDKEIPRQAVKFESKKPLITSKTSFQKYFTNLGFTMRSSRTSALLNLIIISWLFFLSVCLLLLSFYQLCPPFKGFIDALSY